MDQIHRTKIDEPGKGEQLGQRSEKPKLSERPSFPIVASAIGATIVGAVTAFVPLWRVEAFVTAVGISEIIPFAAPPLGTTARIFLILLAAIFAFAALFVILAKSSKGAEDMAQTHQNSQASDKQGFAESIKSKFSGLSLPKFGPARKQKNEQSEESKDRNVTHLSDLKKIRPFETAEESKPAAQSEETARQPILAAKELGSPMMSVPVDNEKVADFRPADPNTPPENAPSLQEIVGRVEGQGAAVAPPPAQPASKPVLPPLVAREADRQNLSNLVNEQRNAAGINFQTTNANADEENDATEAAMTEAAHVPPALSKKPADLSSLNVDELMARLEKGLTAGAAAASPAQAEEPASEPLGVEADEVAQRKTVADEPVFAADHSADVGQETPAPQNPVDEPTAQPDPVVTPLNVADIDETREQKENMDAALKAALDTLQRMTAQGR